MSPTSVGLWLQLLLTVTACNHDHSHTEIRHARSERSDNVFANGRLPRSLRPIHYELELQPFVDNLTFAGKVKIRFRVQSRTSNITLHSASLSLRGMQLLSRNDGVFPPRILSSTFEPMNQFLVMKLDSELQEGRELELHIDYSGVIADNDPAGMYKVNYKDEKGNVRWVVTSQSEPDAARRIFPGFDEPEWKTTFNLTLVRPKALTTTSNMRRIASITRDDNWMEDLFESTVKMSSYLLAFVMGNYTFVEDGTTSTSVIRVWTRPEFMSQTSYALLKGPQVLNFFESFFNVPYNLPKLDLVAIPGMEFGGMENWGVINLDDSIVHYNEKTASLDYKTYFLNFFIHEIAHQWFGNLVTMKWWDDIWLNEGFATYMQTVASDVVEPQWRLSDLFTVDTMIKIMEQDSFNGTDAVQIQNVDIKNLGEVFQYIIYEKGASLIRMMDYFLSRDILQKGLSNYLDTMQYNSATQDDLWRFLTAEAKNCTVLNDTDVKTVMDTWTKQPGYPVVTVFRDYTEQTATLTQKRFFYDKQMKDTTSRWNIPITLTTAADKNFNQTLPTKWMNITDNELMLNQTDGLPSAEDWLILNVQQTGYFRVNYDPFNWNLLIQQLKSNHVQIHPTNRAQILNDILSLARAGIVNYNLALSSTKYLKEEMEYVPWKAAIFTFEYLDAMLSLTSLYGKWKTYVQRLIEPAYKAVGFEDRLSDSYLKRITRSLLVEKACKIGLPSCVQIAQKIYRQWMESNGTSLIAPNLAEAVICTGIKYGGEAEWDFAWRQFVSTIDTALRNTLVKGMTCSREPWILLRYLSASIYGNETFYSEQKRTVLQQIGHYNPVGRYLAFEFLINNWQKYSEFLTLGMTMGEAIQEVTYNMNTEAKLQEVKLFMKSREGSLGVATRPFKIAVNRIEMNIRWMKDNLPTITQWLRKNT